MLKVWTLDVRDSNCRFKISKATMVRTLFIFSYNACQFFVFVGLIRHAS